MKPNNIALTVMLVTGLSLAAAAIAEGQSAAPATENTVTTDVKPAVSVQPNPGVSAGALPVPLASSLLVAEPPALAFTPEQEVRIGEVTHNYLLAHPEVLIEVSEKLEAQRQAQKIQAMTNQVLLHQEALLGDKLTPSYGPDDAKVAFIEFFDYQCVVCAHQATVIESLMKANPQVRYVFKEWPIFAQRWEPSLTAAKTGLQIWQMKGADAYLAYHSAIYATGHNEGKLLQADIKKAAAPVGPLKGKNDMMLEVLSETDTLAQNLGLRGTPAMIVMPMNGATAENVTVFPGGADEKTLQAAIVKAGQASSGKSPTRNNLG